MFEEARAKLREEAQKKADAAAKEAEKTTTTVSTLQRATTNNKDNKDKTARPHAKANFVKAPRLPPNNKNAICTACGYYGYDELHCFLVYPEEPARYLKSRPEDKGKYEVRMKIFLGEKSKKESQPS